MQYEAIRQDEHSRIEEDFNFYRRTFDKTEDRLQKQQIQQFIKEGSYRNLLLLNRR